MMTSSARGAGDLWCDKRGAGQWTRYNNESSIESISEADSLVRLSKFIHANPEIAMEEYKASAACAEFVAERRFDVETNVANLPTAFKSTFGPGGGGHVGFLSEYDALPGLGHGCGHNLIAIAGIAAALGLSEVVDEVGGTVSLFGTPAEEAVGGKIFMAQAGVFDGLDAAMGAHPGTDDAVCPIGRGIGQWRWPVAKSSSNFMGRRPMRRRIPYNGINALNAMIEMFNGINALRQHVKSDARIHGVITDGGLAAECRSGLRGGFIHDPGGDVDLHGRAGRKGARQSPRAPR